MLRVGLLSSKGQTLNSITWPTFRSAQLHRLANNPKCATPPPDQHSEVRNSIAWPTLVREKKATQPENTGRQDCAIKQSTKKDTIVTDFAAVRHYDPGM